MNKVEKAVSVEMGQYLFSYLETACKSRVAIKLARSVSDRELVAIIQAFDSSGVDISSKTKGLHYSSALDAWYRYVPESSSYEFNWIADLEFPVPASQLSIRLINWNTRMALPVEKDTIAVCLYPAASTAASSLNATSILFANGGQALGK